MEVTGPFPVTLGTELDATPPQGGSKFNRVILANASPLACQVNSGGVAQWLQPWSADVYPADGGNPAIITPSFTTGVQSTGNITATWLLPGDPLNGTYPLSLPAQAVAAALVQQGSYQLAGANIINGATTVPVTVPTGIQSLSITGALVNTAPSNVPVSVTSGVGGCPSDNLVFYSDNFSYGPAVVDVIGGQTFNLSLASGVALGACTLTITGSPMPARMYRPDRTDDAYWGSFTGHATANVNASANGTLLAAPPSGMCWDIRLIEAHALPGATTAGDYIELVGLTSGAFVGIAGQTTPSTTIGPLATRLQIEEGIQLQNHLAAAGAVASCFARQIPASI